MCMPQMALSIATEALSQIASADAQNSYARQNAISANQDAVEKYAMEHLSLLQSETKATEERHALMIEGMQTAGTALASSRNEGVSLQSILHDIDRQRARQTAIVDINAENARVHAAETKKVIFNETESRIRAVPTQDYLDPVALAINGLGVVAGHAGGKSGATRDHASNAPITSHGYRTTIFTSPRQGQ